MSSPTDKERGEKPRPLRRRIVIEKADRYHRLLADPSEELKRVRRRAEARGFRIVDFSRTAPDLPLPETSGAAPAGGDLPGIRREIAERLERERGVRLDPETEILPLLHIPESFRFLALAFVNPSDVVLIPDPGDPAYRVSAGVAGGWPISYPLPAGRGFQPDLDRIEPEAAYRARLLFAGYPHMPTGAWAPPGFFADLVRFAKEKNILVAHDATLAAAALGGERPPGLLDHPEGKEVGVEFHSLAPFHQVGGWRPGFAAGNREILFAVETILERLGQPSLAETAAPLRRALDLPPEETARAREVFRSRGALAAEGIRALGWEVEEPLAGFHLWVRVPHGYHSVGFASLLLRKAGIAVLPGSSFGEFGHDRVLISLTEDEGAIRIALDRLARLPRMRGKIAGWMHSGGKERAR
ncbi:MAG: aminotransferase class I/II-fold pyridoxal phosphate-dependent enzyme [Candidatus Eisenbacteria bacterium]